MGLGLLSLGYNQLMTQRQTGTSNLPLMTGMVNDGSCVDASIDGWHSTLLKPSCTHLRSKSDYTATMGIFDIPGLSPTKFWTTQSLEEVDPTTWRVRVGWRFIESGAPPIAYKLVELPWPLTVPQPTPWRALDPFRAPINEPVPLPVPIPPGLVQYRPPLRDRVERPERYRPPRLAPQTVPVFRAPRPPDKGEKEKKFKTEATAKLFMFLAKVMNYGTEGVDFVEALWKALPRDMRSGTKIGQKPGQVSLQQAVQDIYNSWDQLNDEIIGQAIANVIENAVEDHLVGKLEAEWQKAMSRLGRRQTNRPGWQGAPGYQDLINDLWDWYSKQ